MYVDVCTHSVRRKFDIESDYEKDVFPILVDRRNEILPNGLKIPVFKFQTTRTYKATYVRQISISR